MNRELEFFGFSLQDFYYYLEIYINLKKIKSSGHKHDDITVKTLLNNLYCIFNFL